MIGGYRLDKLTENNFFNNLDVLCYLKMCQAMLFQVGDGNVEN